MCSDRRRPIALRSPCSVQSPRHHWASGCPRLAQYRRPKDPPSMYSTTGSKSELPPNVRESGPGAERDCLSW
jgi:hypothetical protein